MCFISCQILRKKSLVYPTQIQLFSHVLRLILTLSIRNCCLDGLLGLHNSSSMLASLDLTSHLSVLCEESSDIISAVNILELDKLTVNETYGVEGMKRTPMFPTHTRRDLPEKIALIS